MNRNDSLSWFTFLLTIVTCMLHVRKRDHVMIAFVHHTLVTITVPPGWPIFSEERNRKRSVLIWNLICLWLRKDPSEDKCLSTELQLLTHVRLVTGQFIQKVLISSRNIIINAQARRLIQTCAIFFRLAWDYISTFCSTIIPANSRLFRFVLPIFQKFLKTVVFVGCTDVLCSIIHCVQWKRRVELIDCFFVFLF